MQFSGTWQILDEERAVGWERWALNGGEGEIVYRAQIETSEPFPHREAIEFVLSPTWQPLVLRLSAEQGRSEATYEGRAVEGRWEIEIVDEKGVTTNHGFPYDTHTELDYLSPIFNIVTFHRLRLSPGRSRKIQVIYMDPVVFTPHWVNQRYTRLDDEPIHIQAGKYQARHYRYRNLDSGWESDMWTDEQEIVLRYRRLYELVEYRKD